jgi:Trypsin-co-occurring domain 1
MPYRGIVRRYIAARLILTEDLGDVMADFVKYELDDGSEVYFESAEASLVSLRGGDAEVVDAGKLGDRLSHIAAAADQVSKGLRERLKPEEIELEFGVKISGEVGWWFFAKATGEASLNVTLTWRKPVEAPPGTGGS